MIKDLTDKFLQHPHYLRNGAGKLANLWKCSPEDVRKARKEAQALLKRQDTTQTALVTSSPVKGVSVTHVATEENLTPSELGHLVGADGISSKVSKYVNKYRDGRKIGVDVEVKVGVDKFYNKQELKEVLDQILPKRNPISLPIIKSVSPRALVVLLADDHAGAINENSLYGSEWNEQVYTQRLLKVSNKIKSLGQTFEEVHVISLGDQLNGFNQQTTRGGHVVRSVSNKDQFLIYLNARTAFYDDLFMSGVSNNYHLHDIENSNHSGNGFSFFANYSLQQWVTFRYPQVKLKSYFQPLNFFEYGRHVVGFCHGKDEKNQKNALPKNMTNQVDLFLCQYFDKNNMSPNKKAITLYKGDLHSYNIEKVKFGRYINIPSVMGNSDYGEINFGHTDAGAVLEILEKDTKSVDHIAVWFE